MPLTTDSDEFDQKSFFGKKPGNFWKTENFWKIRISPEVKSSDQKLVSGPVFSDPTFSTYLNLETQRR